MAIEFVGGTSDSHTGSATYTVSLTGLTGGLASAPAEGDLVVVAAGCTGAADVAIDTNSSGWTKLPELYANDTRDSNFTVFYKIMGSTPDTSIELTANQYPSTCAVHVWRGVDQATPLDVTSTSATGINSARADSPAITPVTAGAVILACGHGTEGNGGVYTVPAGMTNFVQSQLVVVYEATTAIASYSGWTSGAYDPAAWTGGGSSTNDSWAAYTLALRPGSTTQNETRNSTGSIAYSGAAGNYVRRTKTASGNVAFSGTASPPKRTALKDASGSINYTGTVSKTKSVYKSPGGSVSFSGLAGVSFEGVTAATWYAIGSIAFNGAASRARKLNKNTSGSVNFTGLAVKYKSLTYTPDGSIVFGGDSSYVIPTTYTFNSTGGKVYFSGNVSKYKHKNFGTLGGLDFLSAAIISANRAGASVWSADLNAGAAESVALTVNIWDGTVEEAVGSQVSSPNVWGN